MENQEIMGKSPATVQISNEDNDFVEVNLNEDKFETISNSQVNVFSKSAETSPTLKIRHAPKPPVRTRSILPVTTPLNEESSTMQMVKI
jgi:hypothetical protein